MCADGTKAFQIFSFVRDGAPLKYRKIQIQKNTNTNINSLLMEQKAFQISCSLSGAPFKHWRFLLGEFVHILHLVLLAA